MTRPRRPMQNRDISDPIMEICRQFCSAHNIPAIRWSELTTPLIQTVHELLARYAAELSTAGYTTAEVEAATRAVANTWNQHAGLPADWKITISQTRIAQEFAVAALAAVRPTTSSIATAGRCQSKIAHESGAVLTCTVQHAGPGSFLHVNAAHRASWLDDDDRVLTEGDN